MGRELFVGVKTLANLEADSASGQWHCPVLRENVSTFYDDPGRLDRRNRSNNDLKVM
jgi:hypothetical protein